MGGTGPGELSSEGLRGIPKTQPDRNGEPKEPREDGQQELS